jgi:hypothetical protein
MSIEIYILINPRNIALINLILTGFQALEVGRLLCDHFLGKFFVLHQ